MCPSSYQTSTELPNTIQYDAEPSPMPEQKLYHATNEMGHHVFPSSAHSVRTLSLDESGDVPWSDCDHLSTSLETTNTGGSDQMQWSPPSPETLSPANSELSSSSPDGDRGLPIESDFTIEPHLPLPTSTPGWLTYAYQFAMDNRIPYDLLLPGGSLDPALYTPVFVHDTLMLPGSLATVIGKDSPLDILDRLTPARLADFTLLQHPHVPHIPHLTPSLGHSPAAAATGLLLLGTGRDARKTIKTHYRPVAKRIRRKVVIEVKVPVPYKERLIADKKWRLEPRCVEAQVFVGRGVRNDKGGEWELSEALSGAYDEEREEIEVVRGMGGYVVGDDEKSSVDSDCRSEDLRLDGKNDWAGPIIWNGNEIDHESVEW